MTKIRKLKRKKKYRYNVNRKRMNKKKLPDLECKIVKNAWSTKTSSEKNFKNMGLAFDLNKDIMTINRKDTEQTEIVVLEKKTHDTEKPSTAPVVEELRKEAKARKVKNFRLPTAQVKFLTLMMDKYGDDYKAMSKDKKNYLQQTWKQLRSKINTFKKIPEQYNEYLKRKNAEKAET